MSIDAPIRITLEQDGDYAFRIRFDGTELEPLLRAGHELGRVSGAPPSAGIVRWTRAQLGT